MNNDTEAILEMDPDDFESPLLYSHKKILFFHGLESGPHGSKYHALKEVFPGLESPDFQGMDLEQRFAKAEELTRNYVSMAVIGSSMGGLLAAMLYDKYPERFSGYLLLAPALHKGEGKIIKQVPEKSYIVAARQDELIPLADLQAFSAQHTVNIVYVNDTHRLSDSIQTIVNLAKLVVHD